MISFTPLREPQAQPKLGADDTLVIFGEVFSRGYVNGLIDEAKNHGVKIIYSTVGRRSSEGELRPLSGEELAEKSETPLINRPLEAGFDMEADQKGSRPVDQLQGVKMSDWDKAKLDWNSVKEARQRGLERFRTQTKQYLAELEGLVSTKGNVVFVHTMAGGVPRAKIMMPTMNKVFKGTGERFLSSRQFWESDLGRLCAMNFEDVTAGTFRELVEMSASLRQAIQDRGGQVSYLAYGYHGCEVMMGDQYRFQYYSPYLQGWAKLKLEALSLDYHQKGLSTCVFNAPEILTNSSSIFQGVEVPLYPLASALRKQASSPQAQKSVAQVEAKLSSPDALSQVQKLTDEYFLHPEHRDWWQFEKWPQHNTPRQMEAMKETSQRLIDLHKDPKDLMTLPLSEYVFQKTGTIMFRESLQVRKPVWWVGHDVLVKLAR